MRTRRSENGPGLGSQNDESENEIRHSPLKKRIRKDLGQILPRRRVTRSRLAIVEIDASESEGESIGDLAPYDNGSQRSVSYTRHRKLRSRSSPARSKSIPTRRSGRRDQSEDNRPTRSPRRSLRSLRSTRQEDHEEDDEEEKDGITKPKRKKRQFASEITSVLNTAEEHYGNLDMNISMVAKVKERARRRQELREQKERELEEAADDGEDEDEDEDEEDDEEEEEEGDEVEEDNEKGYSLRRNRASTKRYGEIVVDEPRRVKVVKRQPVALFSRSGAHRSDRRSSIFSSEKKSRSHRRRKKMSAASSSSSSSSSDEEHFQKKKHRQMEKSRLSMLPMNLSEDQVNRRSGFRDRERIGASLADVDPMEFDKSINFKSVGGHPKAIKQLQEMVVLPLLYPDVFSKFKVSPPRGVLFYGPPGTGKTLMARALVNECSKDGKKVAFFMRKGSDVLSKWVGESERQLRLLFDQAFRMRPSVIFFDEIDGLAPVRSSRQDHIHSSIVSTLLALMDGLDSRGEVIIIGATNRIDSIDPALRRPGRFDREILFQLPGADARKEILKIHTKDWEEKLSDDFLNELATKTNGYCGADLKALCTESVLNTLRRTYPSVYRTQKKIAIDTKTLKPNQIDFENSIKRIIPASVRSDNSASMPLSKSVEPLLNIQLTALLDRVNHIWPQIELKSSKLESKSQNTLKKIFDCDLDSTAAKNATYRPRLLITGPAENGQTQIARALLDNLDHMKTVQLTLPQIYSSSTRTTEDSLAEAIREASRHGNSILFIPEIISFWDGLTESSKSGSFSILISSIANIHSSQGTILLATNSSGNANLPIQLKDLFNRPWKDRYSVDVPTAAQRRDYFSQIKSSSKSETKNFSTEAELLLRPVDYEVTEEDQSVLTKTQIADVEQKEEATMRTLRIFLRNLVTRLAQEQFGMIFLQFTKPVDQEEIPDYYDIIENPMDLSIIMVNIDEHEYETVEDMLKDINLIVDNTLEYNPDNYHEERMVRHRACLLKDFAHELVERELDPAFEKTCQEIKIARRIRGASKTKFAPQYIDCDDEEKTAQEKELLQEQIGSRDQVSEMTEGELYWVEYRDVYHLAKLLNIKDDEEPHAYGVNLVTLQKIHTFIGKEKFRQVLESDDINSVLKSPIIKSRKKRRKRSSWATGVIKKAKKPVKNAEENENEHNEEPQKGEILAIEPSSNGILVKSEEKPEEQMDTSMVEGPNLEPSGLEDSRVQDEPDSIDKENDASNDSNKENHFPIKTDAQPEVIPPETVERRVTRNSLREESDPEPERRITRNSKRDETSTLKSPSSIRTKSAARPEKRVQIEPIKKTIPIEDLWTEEEIKIARQELTKVNDKIIIDENKLDEIFEKIVEQSNGWAFEKIYEFGCHLNTIIYKYRSTADRSTLCQELEKSLEFM